MNDIEFLPQIGPEAVDVARGILLDDVPVEHHGLLQRDGIRDALESARPSLVLPVLREILGDSPTIEEAVLGGSLGTPVGEYVITLEHIVRRLCGAIQEVSDAREDHLPNAGAFTRHAPEVTAR